MQARFSTRRLMIFVTLVAIACGFLVAPTFPARRFVTAVNSGDYQELISIGFERSFWDYKAFPLQDLKIRAVLHPKSWRDIFQFRRRVSIDVWPPANAKNVAPQSSAYAFTRITGTKLGGETWE